MNFYLSSILICLIVFEEVERLSHIVGKCRQHAHTKQTALPLKRIGHRIYFRPDRHQFFLFFLYGLVIVPHQFQALVTFEMRKEK